MTERHQMRTLTKNQMALFFWNGVVHVYSGYYVPVPGFKRLY
jgi:hypothetical protein